MIYSLFSDNPPSFIEKDFLPLVFLVSL